MASRANQVLRKLLDLSQSNPNRVRDVTLPVSRIQDYPFRNATLSREFHLELQLAEEAGVISVKWRRHYEHEELVQIRLLSQQKLVGFLGETPLRDRVDATLDGIDLTGAPDWLVDAMKKLEVNWLKNQRAFGLSVDDGQKLPDVIRAITALMELGGETLDWRQFGARYLNDSKRLSSISGPVCAILKAQFCLENLSNSDILRQFNLEKLAHPVLIHGPFSVGDENQTVDASIYPYIGIPVCLLKNIRLYRTPTYLLTIENLSSFNEYVNSIDDGGIVLYTAGYPVRALQNFYSSLVEQSKLTKVFHWGDTDPDGFLILKTLQQNLGEIPVHPHQMEPEPGEGIGFTKTQLKKMRDMLPISPTVDTVLKKLVERGAGLTEQESNIPFSPLSL